MVDGNKLGEAGFKYLGTPYSTMDCQAFVERCLLDCGLNKNLAGSNAWFREVYRNGVIMTPEDCVKQLGTVPKGAFLFILNHDGKEPEKYKPDGLGNASHIGLVTGRGEGAIHSSSSKGCVCESKFKNKSISGGWNRVGLWDQVSYDYSGGGTPTPTPTPTPEPEPEPVYETAIATAPSGKYVNIRKMPSKASALVDRVPLRDAVTVTSHGSEWCKVKWKQKAGYMMTMYLSFDGTDPEPEPEPEPVPHYVGAATVVASSGRYVKMRKSPSTNCNLYDEIPIGAVVTVVESGGKWSKVNYGKRKGWYMMSQFLELNG